MGHQQTRGSKVKREWKRGRVGERDGGREGEDRQTKFEHWEESDGQLLQIGDDGPPDSQKWCLGSGKTARILVKKLCGDFRVKKSSRDWEAWWSDTTASVLCLPVAQLSHKPLGSGIAV